VIALKSIHLGSDEAELIRQNHAQAISELQQMPSASLKVVGPITLADNVFVLVPHGLGRVPSLVIGGLPNGAGAAGITAIFHSGQLGAPTFDETKSFCVKANLYSTTITQSFGVM